MKSFQFQNQLPLLSFNATANRSVKAAKAISSYPACLKNNHKLLPQKHSHAASRNVKWCLRHPPLRYQHQDWQALWKIRSGTQSGRFPNPFNQDFPVSCGDRNQFPELPRIGPIGLVITMPYAIQSRTSSVGVSKTKCLAAKLNVMNC